MSTGATVIAGCALVTFAIKAAGPVALGGRELPIWFTSVQLAIGADTAGVAAGGLVAWRTGSIIACVLVAPAVTAGLRLL